MEVRRKPGLSQEELAHVLAVSFATAYLAKAPSRRQMNRWENGKTSPWKLAQRQFASSCEAKHIAREAEDDSP